MKLECQITMSSYILRIVQMVTFASNLRHRRYSYSLVPRVNYGNGLHCLFHEVFFLNFTENKVCDFLRGLFVVIKIKEHFQCILIRYFLIVSAVSSVLTFSIPTSFSNTLYQTIFQHSENRIIDTPLISNLIKGLFTIIIN